ncbi:hypothetical protein UFOVP1254_31 [uncultured Caudovirales phage]|uniref:Uncharacterized protein n=1 Tax=uncultured Caudovirales phage TaxID=2100421 RepID=A0A6J5RBM3_9CAUD|nr:hypothetical protein UFOVP1254_31 [uncultured Caudovirales phage]
MAIVQIVSKWGQARRTIGLPVKPQPRLAVAVDVTQQSLEYGANAANASEEFHMNLFADDMHDEFGDVDNEFEGLTIVEPRGTMGLFAFCSGHDVL